MLKKLFKGLQVTIQSHCTECGFMLPTGVLVEISAEQCAAVASHHAEQECIGFHKFIVSQSFHYDYRGETFNRISEKDKFYTHKELYQLYIQSKSNQT